MTNDELLIQGARIKQIIDSLVLSQKEVAEQLGFSQPFISQIISGKSEATHRFLKKLSSSYSVNVDWVISGRGQMFISGVMDEANQIQSDAAQKEDIDPFLRSNIFLIRHRWNRDQAEFGALLGGFTRHQVSNWERGRTDPDYNALSRLEALSGIPQKKIRTQELSRSEIPELPNPMQVPLPAPPVSLSDVYELQQEILRRVASIEDILRALKDQEAAAGK